MKTIKLCVFIYVLGFTLAAFAQDIDRYEDFWRHGVFDITVSNQTVNDIVLAGITSNDAEVVSLTIKALGNLGSSTMNFNTFTFGLLPSGLIPSGPVPIRALQDVPGLKEFLINHWMEQYESHGYIQERLEGGFPALMAYEEEADLSEEDALKEFKERWISWTMIPLILCTWWPGDSDVHQLLWHQQDTGSTSYVETLSLLNIGNFTTPEADAFRIKHLSGPSGSDFIAVALAALGLAMNHPMAALPHLIAAGEEHTEAPAIWIALSAYDDDQLVPYAEDIQAMLSGKPIYADDAISKAYDSLNRITALSTH